jgi:DHA1 family bicyclomycin/chloramphenicol resistance-like MFS transporter
MVSGIMQPHSQPAPASFRLKLLLTALVAFGPISTDLYLASLPDMARYFAVDVAAAQMTLSAFLLGMAVSMPFYGPLSDRFGRRPVILGGVALYLVASLFCVVAPTIEALVAGRFFQALGATCGPVVGRAVVRDVFPREQAARVLSYMASAMALAPLVGPVLGGWLHSWFGWRANFVLLVVFGVVMAVGVWRVLAETNRHKDPAATALSAMLINYRILLRDRMVLGYALVVLAGYGGLFTFISGSSFVLIDALGVDVRRFGFAFGVVIAGYVAGAYLAGRLTHRIGLDRMIGLGSVLCALAGSVGAALALAGVHSVAAVLAPLSVFFLGAGLMLPNATAGALGPHARMAGAVASFVGLLQMSGSALAGWVTVALFDSTPRSMMAVNGLMGVAGLLVFVAVIRRARPNS